MEKLVIKDGNGDDDYALGNLISHISKFYTKPHM